MTGTPPGRLFLRRRHDPLLRGGREHKQAVLRRLLDDLPEVTWVLVGDDGLHDPDLFADLAARFPDRVAAVALRQVLGPGSRRRETARAPDTALAVPGGLPVVGWVTAPNGEELLPLLQVALGLDGPSGGAVTDWLLTGEQRGSPATDVRAWTEGNAARPLVHGRAYFPVLADALGGAGEGDRVVLAGWRGDADELLTPIGPTVADALCSAARRGALVRGLLWRSHLSSWQYAATENRQLAEQVNTAGGQVLLDQRIRPLGSHHQKLVVVRHPDRPDTDVAFLGGIDLAHGRADDARHDGDSQTRGGFAKPYGTTPAWHDVQVELRGPAVADVERVFTERWQDPAALVRLPWHLLPDRLRRLPRTGSPLPPALPDPPAAGTCTVQILRTAPRRWPRHPFAPRGERSVARAYAKALHRAQALVYLEDQYLWSVDIARIFASALARSPRLHLIAVVPRHPDQEGPLYLGSAGLGQGEALAMVQAAGGERVQILDVENDANLPVYVHAKVCVVDDVWATVGSDNFNLRSWTHDSELTAAVLDDQRDPRAPADPGGLGDGARTFARQLRLDLLREHLNLNDDDLDEPTLTDPEQAARVVRLSATRLDAWHDAGRVGTRPPGRLRRHELSGSRPWHHAITEAAYRTVLDPDGRPLGMKLRRTF